MSCRSPPESVGVLSEFLLKSVGVPFGVRRSSFWSPSEFLLESVDRSMISPVQIIIRSQSKFLSESVGVLLELVEVWESVGAQLESDRVQSEFDRFQSEFDGVQSEFDGVLSMSD